MTSRPASTHDHKKRQRRLTGADEIALSLPARGLTTGAISAHFAEVYGATVWRERVSKITNAVLEEIAAWTNRSLDQVHLVIFVDAIIRAAAQPRSDLHRFGGESGAAVDSAAVRRNDCCEVAARIYHQAFIPTTVASSFDRAGVAAGRV